jgi:cytochrome b subunit of formate dehydrogenase
MTTAATGTDVPERPAPAPAVRNNAATRAFHGANFLVVAGLLATGWWLRAGNEGRPSLLARAFDTPDAELHRRVGWALVGLAAVGVTLGARGAWTFVRETARADRGDGAWLLRWPLAAVTGAFRRHRGHFDPGQRLANLAFVVTLGTLIVTGVAMTTLSGGPTFATMVRLHRAATVALTVLVIGHLIVVSGLLPGYRGAWRAMVTGRVPVRTARRLWPEDAAPGPGADRPTGPAS